MQEKQNKFLKLSLDCEGRDAKWESVYLIPNITDREYSFMLLFNSYILYLRAFAVAARVTLCGIVVQNLEGNPERKFAPVFDHVLYMYVRAGNKRGVLEIEYLRQYRCTDSSDTYFLHARCAKTYKEADTRELDSFWMKRYETLQHSSHVCPRGDWEGSPLPECLNVHRVPTFC